MHLCVVLKTVIDHRAETVFKEPLWYFPPACLS